MPTSIEVKNESQLPQKFQNRILLYSNPPPMTIYTLMLTFQMLTWIGKQKLNKNHFDVGNQFYLFSVFDATGNFVSASLSVLTPIFTICEN